MDPGPFEVGAASRIIAWTLAGLVAAYAAGTGWYAWKAFQRQLQDRWSAAVGTLVMTALAVLLAVDGPAVVPTPFSIWVVAGAAFWIIFVLTFTLGRYQERIGRFTERFGARLTALLEAKLPEERRAELDRLRERWQDAFESRRKSVHLLMGIFIALYLGGGYLVVRGVWELAYGGGTPATGAGIQNLYAASHAEILVGGHMFMVFFMLFAMLGLVPNELLRLRFPELSYPFKSLIVSNLREKEAGLFGGHFYLATTLPLALLWLGRDPAYWNVTLPAIVGMFAVTIFADTASALVGIRFGKRRLWHNPGKTWVGTFGGIVVAFLVALPFVGVTMAIVSAAVFLLVDVLAPVPFPVSDNILHPLGLAAAYTLLQGQLAPLFPFY